MTQKVPGRSFIVGAALPALFLGAMDALVMSAAMPTIITELGGLHPLGGFIVTYFSWRWIFYINVPLGILSFLVTSTLSYCLETAARGLDPQILARLRESVEILFKPEFMDMILHGAKTALHEAVLKGVSSVFLIVCVASAAGLLCCWFVPGKAVRS